MAGGWYGGVGEVTGGVIFPVVLNLQERPLKYLPEQRLANRRGIGDGGKGSTPCQNTPTTFSAAGGPVDLIYCAILKLKACTSSR